MEYILVANEKGYFLKDDKGNYFPFRFPGSGGGGTRKIIQQISGGGSDIWHTDGVGISFSSEEPGPTVLYTSPFANTTTNSTPPFNVGYSRYRYLGAKSLTASNLILQVQSDSFTTSSVKITVQNNGLDTALFITVPPGTASGTIISNTTDTFPIATTNEVSVKIEIINPSESGNFTLRYLTFQTE